MPRTVSPAREPRAPVGTYRPPRGLPLPASSTAAPNEPSLLRAIVLLYALVAAVVVVVMALSFGVAYAVA